MKSFSKSTQRSNSGEKIWESINLPQKTKQKPVELKQDTKRLHVISNTHWDREHRHGFQETRYMLVEMFDRLIEIMESNAEYANFVLDGQSIPLEDYLDIRPEMTQRLTQLIRTGRIHIGPWYSLPDMQSVNPEGLVRNLLMGDRLCKQFGRKMNFGYSIFSFGQIAQLPQLYQGFDIDDMIVYKGCSTDIFKDSEFIWTAPDGSKVLASCLGKLARSNFLFCFTIPVLLGGDALKPGWTVRFTDGARLCHLIDQHFRTQFASELEQDIRVRKEKIEKGIKDTLESVEDSLAKKTFLAFDGVDFACPIPQLTDALRQANAIMDGKVHIVHSCPTAYFEDLRHELDFNELFDYTGELRFGPMGQVHSECLSANVEIKQQNHKAENIILYYAEPFSVFNALCGGKYPFGMLQRAWKYLFQSQAHDSIHGIGVPKIKRDVQYRLEQAQEIADSVSRRAFEGILAKIDTSNCSNDDILITAFNPTPCLRSEVINLKIDFPKDEYVGYYHLESITGERQESFEYGKEYTDLASVNSENRPKLVTCDRRDVDFLLKDVPPLGYKTFRLKRCKENIKKITPFPNPVLPYTSIAQSPNVLDNGLLRVEVAPDGTIDVTDIKNGACYTGLNLFTDTGCAGDFWIHRPPSEDEIITNFGRQASVSITRNSSLRGVLDVDTVLHIPEALNANRKSRSKHKVPMKISTQITLTKSSRRLDLKVSMENRAKDHRLTVGFPTGIKTDYVNSENAFEIRKRSADYRTSNDGVVGDVVLRQPMNCFVDITDGIRGLALFTKGIKEFETSYRHEENVLCELTLLRSVSQKFPIHNDVFVCFDDEPVQCQGWHEFEYALFFHDGDTLEGDVIGQSRIYQNPLVAGQYGKGSKGTLPLEEISFIKLADRNTILNCVKQSEDNQGFIIRLNNPTAKTINEQVSLYHNSTKAYIVNLNEEIIQEVPIEDSHTVQLSLPPYKIVTLLLM